MNNMIKCIYFVLKYDIDPLYLYDYNFVQWKSVKGEEIPGKDMAEFLSLYIQRKII